MHTLLSFFKIGLTMGTWAFATGLGVLLGGALILLAIGIVLFVLFFLIIKLANLF